MSNDVSRPGMIFVTAILSTAVLARLSSSISSDSVRLVWRNMFSQFIINDLKFKPTSADPDVYLRRAKRNDGTEYYEMLLVYVDDVLCISEDPMTIMKMIGDKFDIKNNEIIPPKMYLGGGIEKRTLFDNEHKKVGDFWSMDSKKYSRIWLELWKISSRKKV